MKKFLLKIVENYLATLARSKILRSKPKIVAITGSYGKTSTKEAIFSVLQNNFGNHVGKNWGNMNSTVGLPMAVLGLKNYHFGLGILGDLFKSFWNYLFYKMPNILVLELGIDKPGEMDKLLKIIKPNVAILTGVAETHLEELKDISGVRVEKMKLLESLPKDGLALINADDKNIGDIKFEIGANVLTFGEKGEIHYKNFQVTENGSQFDLVFEDTENVIISKLIAKHSINSLLVAFGVAKYFQISDEKIIQTLEKIKPEKGRMNLIKAKNGILIIDDSYNSSPASAIAALKALSDFKFSGRKVAILGNMNELGKDSDLLHQKVGKSLPKNIDLFVFVGPNADNFAKGVAEINIDSKKIIKIDNTKKLIEKIDDIIKAGDLVLVKASQNNMRFERVVAKLIDNPDISKQLLVRQENKWKNK